MTESAESPHLKPNTYEMAPEDKGEKIGYDAADPKFSDEGYTAEGVLRHRNEQAPWGRTAEGEKGDRPDQ
ncbi:MAG TPA: hypothetical protein PLF56_05720 [Micropruina sp.]|jgi:hypothetical protein|nr:hypothetical protein [Micropruina sp.]